MSRKPSESQLLNCVRACTFTAMVCTPIIFNACTSTQIKTATSAVENVFQQNSTLTTDEVSKGLKEALTQGISKGSDQASQVDGYFRNALLKIIVPPEMQEVNQKLRSLGMNKLMDDFELSLNRGAEAAAQKAKPVFISAITAMTIQDVWSILKGGEDAATQYLKRTTQQQLHEAFKPVIHNSLQEVNATKYYSQIASVYNQIPTKQKINPDLDDYVTGRAIDGLFVLIRQEESNIRSNASARATALLKKVFAPENTK